MPTKNHRPKFPGRDRQKRDGKRFGGKNRNVTKFRPQDLGKLQEKEFPVFLPRDDNPNIHGGYGTAGPMD